MPVPYGRGCYKRIRNRKSVKGWKDDGHRLQKKFVVSRCARQKKYHIKQLLPVFGMKSFDSFVLSAAKYLPVRAVRESAGKY